MPPDPIVRPEGQNPIRLSMRGAAFDPLRTFVAVTSDVDYGGGRGAVNISHVINRS